VREIRTLRSMWRGLETWLERRISIEAGAPVPDPTTEEAIAAWAAEPRTTRGGQPWYSPLAILTALTLRTVFRLAFRQTEGLIGSIIALLGLTLRVPDHTTLRPYPGRACRQLMMAQAKWSVAR
jgi:hypothetical protein